MTIAEFTNIFFVPILLLLGHVVCEMSVIWINSAVLQEMPYRLDDTHLLGLTLDERRKVCAKIRAEIDVFVFQPSYFYYVPEAHVYKFDAEDWLALQCPTFPVIYVSHDWVKESTLSDHHQWYVRMMRLPHADEYKFKFEATLTVKSINDYDVNSALRSKKHIFHDMDHRMYWHLCNEARKRIRYEFDLDKGYVNSGPKFYEFTSEVIEKVTALAIHCFRAPNMYIRTEHESIEENNLIIISLAYHSEKYEMLSTKNVD